MADVYLLQIEAVDREVAEPDTMINEARCTMHRPGDYRLCHGSGRTHNQDGPMRRAQASSHWRDVGHQCQ